MIPQEVKDRINFTPAERALVLEQVETMKVSADLFAEAIKDGADSLPAFYETHQCFEYVGKVLATKIQKAIYEVAQEEETDGDG